MKLQKVLSNIALLTDEQLDKLAVKLFEKKLMTFERMNEGYNKAMLLERNGNALSLFKEVCDNPNETNTVFSLSLLSDLLFLRIFDVEEFLKLDYNDRTKSLCSYSDISFISKYKFPFVVKTEEDKEDIIKEGLEIFSYANKVIKKVNQNIISRSKFYKIKNLFIKYVLSHNVYYSWHIEEKSDKVITGEKYAAITIMHNGNSYKFHQVYNNISLALNLENIDSEPTRYSKDDDINNYDDNLVIEYLLLIKLFYLKFLK